MNDYAEFLKILLAKAQEFDSNYMNLHWNKETGKVYKEYLPQLQRMLLFTSKISTELINLKSES